MKKNHLFIILMLSLSSYILAAEESEYAGCHAVVISNAANEGDCTVEDIASDEGEEVVYGDFIECEGAWVDLEEKKQNFILFTKQLKINKYPDAFNPSIVKWHGKYLLSFRARDPITGVATIIGLSWLNKNFDLVGEPYILKVQQPELAGDYIQDPRLIVINDRLIMVYSNLWKLPGKEARRVSVGEVIYDGVNFKIDKPQVLLYFDGIPNNKFEKNWVPFEYNGDLLLGYSINPHKIFYPHLDKKKCDVVALTEMKTNWKWGEFRGGSQALKVDGQYLSFFHSSKQIKTKHSHGKLMTHYFMGAYTFDDKPPFAISKISPTIIVADNFYEGPIHNTWKPLRVVFPCGFVEQENAIWVSYGRQDFEMWLVKMDKKKLMQSLVKVKKVP